MQYTLYTDEQGKLQPQENFEEKAKEEEPKEEPRDEVKAEFTIEYCKKAIITDFYLWDMRCWDKYKDKEEVMRFLEAFVEDDFALNCGHTLSCINAAINIHRIPKEDVAEWMLSNPHTQFSKRIVPCWKNPEKCPKYAAQGNYGNKICDECDKQ